jgi:hypothetical protein
MKGYQALLNARMNGYKPLDVWVFVGADPHAGHFINPENNLHDGYMAEVWLPENSVIGTLDLRALHGVTTHIIGDNKNRVLQTGKRIQQFKPAKVICSGSWGIDTMETI